MHAFFEPTLDDLVLLRTWVRGLPLATLPFPITPAVLARLTELRNQLYLKALRLQQPDAGLWLKRQSQANWEQSALASLDRLLALPDLTPDHHQPLRFWLPPALSATLSSKDCQTVEDVIALYQHQGVAWWQGIPRLGRIGARRVEKIIEILFPGNLVKPPVIPVLSFETGIVPLERLLLPTALDGRQGHNRAGEAPFIPMAHDLEAIEAWLALYGPARHTARSYRREAERLLLWSIVTQQKALSSLDARDMATYRTFLQDPQPAQAWIGPPRTKLHPHWKPFTGPLSSRSTQHAETILHGLFDFLVQQRYWQHNPLSALPRLKAPTGAGIVAVQRAFSPALWARIMATAEQAVSSSTRQARRKAIRTQLILQLAYATGLRLSELAQAKVGNITALERQGQTQTWLSVLGKGQKLRQVPLPPGTLASITGLYRALTGRELLRQVPETPLISDLRDDHKAVTPLAVHKVLKSFFAEAARECEQESPEAATRLAKASAHWLRHTHGSRAVDQGIPLVMVRDNLGHASLATTSQYLHVEADARYEAFEHFTDAAQSNKNI
jgi:site-specific recombinase XerD